LLLWCLLVWAAALDGTGPRCQATGAHGGRVRGQVRLAGYRRRSWGP